MDRCLFIFHGKNRISFFLNPCFPQLPTDVLTRVTFSSVQRTRRIQTQNQWILSRTSGGEFPLSIGSISWIYRVMLCYVLSGQFAELARNRLDWWLVLLGIFKPRAAKGKQIGLSESWWCRCRPRHHSRCREGTPPWGTNAQFTDPLPRQLANMAAHMIQYSGPLCGQCSAFYGFLESCSALLSGQSNLGFQGRIQDFGQGGQCSFDPRGA